MAKKKKVSRKQKIVSKVINIGGILIGMSRIFEIIFNNLRQPAQIATQIIKGATFGLSAGGLNIKEGVRFYAPVGGAIGYRVFTSYLLKKFPVR